jgi:flagellar hook-basal body complex protein FliE
MDGPKIAGIPAVYQKISTDRHNKKGNEENFSGVLKDSIQKVNNLQVEANKAIQDLATGRTENIHEAMIAIEKADISFKMMMQVRNKILEAYREIIHMQF